MWIVLTRPSLPKARLVPQVDVGFITAKGMLAQSAALSKTPVHWLFEGAFLPVFARRNSPCAATVYQAEVAFVGESLHPPVQDPTLALRRFQLERVSAHYNLKIWGVQGNPTASWRWGSRSPLIEWQAQHAELVKVCRSSAIVLGLKTINFGGIVFFRLCLFDFGVRRVSSH